MSVQFSFEKLSMPRLLRLKPPSLAHQVVLEGGPLTVVGWETVKNRL